MFRVLFENRTKDENKCILAVMNILIQLLVESNENLTGKIKNIKITQSKSKYIIW